MASHIKTQSIFEGWILSKNQAQLGRCRHSQGRCVAPLMRLFLTFRDFSWTRRETGSLRTPQKVSLRTPNNPDSPDNSPDSPDKQTGQPGQPHRQPGQQTGLPGQTNRIARTTPRTTRTTARTARTNKQDSPDNPTDSPDNRPDCPDKQTG